MNFLTFPKVIAVWALWIWVWTLQDLPKSVPNSIGQDSGPLLAVWVRATLNWKFIAILTKDQKIECTSGNLWLEPQQGNRIDSSYISPDFAKLNVWSWNLTLTTEEKSWDIIVRQNWNILAVLRKDGERKLEAFHWFYPNSTYCNKNYWSDWVMMR